MNAAEGLQGDRLAPRDFARLAAFIEDYSGIKMPPGKLALVEGRLRRRLRELGLASFHAYCDHVFAAGNGDEVVRLIDAVTTNKNEFFREPEHFTFLRQVAVPELMAQGAGLSQPLTAWSAACSIGAEPYTLAMVLGETALETRGFRYRVVGTDLCTEVLDVAATAIYPEEMAAPVPDALRRRYLMRARDPQAREIRVIPELRRLVRFLHMNLMEPAYPLPADMDVIFCRNVLIYFNRETQAAVLRRLAEHLRPGGYLFIGHSETVSGMNLPVRQIAPTVFKRV